MKRTGVDHCPNLDPENHQFSEEKYFAGYGNFPFIARNSRISFYMFLPIQSVGNPKIADFMWVEGMPWSSGLARFLQDARHWRRSRRRWKRWRWLWASSSVAMWESSGRGASVIDPRFRLPCSKPGSRTLEGYRLCRCQCAAACQTGNYCTTLPPPQSRGPMGHPRAPQAAAPREGIHDGPDFQILPECGRESARLSTQIKR